MSHPDYEIRLIIAQYKQGYPGQYMPNVMEAWDEYVLEDNQSGYEEKLKEHRDRIGKDYEDVKELIVVVPQDTILDLFAPEQPVIIHVETKEIP